jgi:hypothetical protein
MEQDLKRSNDFLENRIPSIKERLLSTRISQKAFQRKELLGTVFVAKPKTAACGLSSHPCPGLAEQKHSAFPNNLIYRFKKFWSRIPRPKQTCD